MSGIIILFVSFVITVFFINWMKSRKKRSGEYETYLKKGYEDLNKCDNIKSGRAKLQKIDHALKNFKKAFSIYPGKEAEKKIVDCEKRKKRLLPQSKNDF